MVSNLFFFFFFNNKKKMYLVLLQKSISVACLIPLVQVPRPAGKQGWSSPHSTEAAPCGALTEETASEQCVW